MGVGEWDGHNPMSEWLFTEFKVERATRHSNCPD